MRGRTMQGRKQSKQMRDFSNNLLYATSTKFGSNSTNVQTQNTMTYPGRIKRFAQGDMFDDA